MLIPLLMIDMLDYQIKLIKFNNTYGQSSAPALRWYLPVAFIYRCDPSNDLHLIYVKKMNSWFLQDCFFPRKASVHQFALGHSQLKMSC